MRVDFLTLFSMRLSQRKKKKIRVTNGLGDVEVFCDFPKSSLSTTLS